MKISSLFCAVAAGAVVAASPLVLRNGAPGASGGATSTPRVPGVVLVCVDTLRGDAVDPAGGADAWMPRLDEFARDATVFADASAPAAWTAPSVSTLLSGLVPSRHGVRSECGMEASLVPQVRTLAEMLRAAGWSTAALTGGGWVAPNHGLAQGFDAFGCTLDVDGPEAAIAMWRRKTEIEKAPFFLFLHTYAAHAPYGAASKSALATATASAETVAVCDEIVRRLAAGEAVLPSALLRRVVTDFLTDGAARATYAKVLGSARSDVLWAHCTRWMDEGFAVDPERVELAARLKAAYVAGLRHADDVVARILESLDRAGLPKETAIVVVGDHGEAFGEHGTVSHGRRLYDELLRVPLVVRAPGLARGVVHGSCGLIDVLPTILDLAGAPTPADLDGRSLLALGQGRATGRPIVAEEVRRSIRADDGGVERLTSVRTETAKFILTVGESTGAARSELFDLVADPGEQHPLEASAAPRFGVEFALAVERAEHGALRVVPAAPTPVNAVAKPLAARVGE